MSIDPKDELVKVIRENGGNLNCELIATALLKAGWVRKGDVELDEWEIDCILQNNSQWYMEGDMKQIPCDGKGGFPHIAKALCQSTNKIVKWREE